MAGLPRGIRASKVYLNERGEAVVNIYIAPWRKRVWVLELRVLRALIGEARTLKLFPALMWIF